MIRPAISAEAWIAGTPTVGDSTDLEVPMATISYRTPGLLLVLQTAEDAADLGKAAREAEVLLAAGKKATVAE